MRVKDSRHCVVDGSWEGHHGASRESNSQSRGNFWKESIHGEESMHVQGRGGGEEDRNTSLLEGVMVKNRG